MRCASPSAHDVPLKHAPSLAGVRQRRFHDLRTTHITWLLSGGADVSAVMRRVGHTRLSTTQVYLAALPDADSLTVDALIKVRSRHRGGRRWDGLIPLLISPLALRVSP